MKDKTEPGKIIDQAYKIIRRTYQEIYSMKDDFVNVLREIDPSFELSEEYSYGPKSLYLKEYHIFLFKRNIGEEEELNEESIVGVVILFSTVGEHKKLSSIDGPEIWVCKVETKNIKKKARARDIADCLTPSGREYFTDKNLEIGGKVYNYHWKAEEEGEDGEVWIGQFVGYPLTDVKDRTFIKEMIVDKLAN